MKSRAGAGAGAVAGALFALEYLLVAQALQRSEQAWPGQGNRISAQAHLERFYNGLGFERVGENYGEDNIPHCQMWRRP